MNEERKGLRVVLLALVLLAGRPALATAQRLVLGEHKISAFEAPLARELEDDDRFGAAVTALGDLNGDGVGDMAVGAPGDDDGSGSPFAQRGAIWILFLNADGSVQDGRKVGASTNGFRVLADGDAFGSALAALDDLDGNGVRELAVGAPGDDEAGQDAGAVWILFPRADGTIEKRRKITGGLAGFDADEIEDGDALGSSLARVGDLDGDGLEELAVGAPGIDDRGRDTGGVWILFLDAEGSVRRRQRISSSAGRFGWQQQREEHFGAAAAGIGDLDGDGVPDLAVGAPGNDDAGDSSGAVWILFLRPDGQLHAKQKISARAGGFGGALDPRDFFGSALASPGDLDTDGVADLVVGAPSDDDAGSGAGAVWILSMKRDGTVARERKITAGSNGLEGSLRALDLFGSSLARLDDLDGVARPEIAVGATGDDDGGDFSLSGHGALWVLFLDDGTFPQARVRNGSGANSLCYTSLNLPFVGHTWIAEIDASHHPGATLTVIMAFDRGHPGIRTPLGELLVRPRGLGGFPIFRSVADSGGGLALHAHRIPGDLSLAGREASTQGVILGGTMELVNAIDLRVGY